MSATTPRRHHDFRRVTDVTTNRASDGDTLYRMSSHRIDNICQGILVSSEINLAAWSAANYERSE
jgi:hypothetical protein